MRIALFRPPLSGRLENGERGKESTWRLGRREKEGTLRRERNLIVPHAPPISRSFSLFPIFHCFFSLHSRRLSNVGDAVLGNASGAISQVSACLSCSPTLQSLYYSSTCYAGSVSPLKQPLWRRGMNRLEHSFKPSLMDTYVKVPTNKYGGNRLFLNLPRVVGS